jgi:hypothetical protein
VEKDKVIKVVEVDIKEVAEEVMKVVLEEEAMKVVAEEDTQVEEEVTKF